MSFRLITILWLFALLASAMGTLGPVLGLIAVGFFLFIRAVWTWAKAAGKRQPAIAMMLAFVAVLIVFLLLPVAHSSRAPSFRGRSMSQMKQLVLAMHNYRSLHGRFPPPYSTDEERNVLHGWRTLLLPCLEEQRLFNAIRKNEPWNSSSNQSLLGGLALDLLHSCRSGMRASPATETHYLAVVDDCTLWAPDPDGPRPEVTDDPASTIAIIEVAGRRIPWYEPRDLSLEEALDLLTGATADEHETVHTGFFTSTHIAHDGPYPRLVGFADGRVQPIYKKLDRETALALLTWSGGEEVDMQSVTERRRRDDLKRRHTVHWGRVWSLSLFIVLGCLPTRWVLGSTSKAN